MRTIIIFGLMAFAFMLFPFIRESERAKDAIRKKRDDAGL